MCPGNKCYLCVSLLGSPTQRSDRSILCLNMVTRECFLAMILIKIAGNFFMNQLGNRANSQGVFTSSFLQSSLVITFSPTSWSLNIYYISLYFLLLVITQYISVYLNALTSNLNLSNGFNLSILCLYFFN